MSFLFLVNYVDSRIDNIIVKVVVSSSFIIEDPISDFYGIIMSEEKDAVAQANEDSIKVICRFRPLNDTEEKTGSKFIIKFPSGSDDQCVSIGVRMCF